MILKYRRCIEKRRSSYQIKKALAAGKLYRLEKGIYSTEPTVPFLAILTTKYPAAIITMDTAFYYHGLTDLIPDKYCIASPKSARTLRDTRIQQYFIKKELWELGVITMKRNHVTFRIYDKERMLIELLRFKNKLPYDYYKEILGNYRTQIPDLDIARIQEYASIFPKHKMISTLLESEVF